MKRFLTVITAICIAAMGMFTLTACNNNDDTLVLKVGMECAYQPYNWTQFTDENGAVAIQQRSGEYANGYDIMIAKKIADALGMKLEVYAYEWESLVPAVKSGALDLIIAGMSPTEERKQEIDFTDPYYTSNLVVVVRKDGKFANAENLAALSGAKIVAQTETFHDTVIDQIPNVEHVTSMKDFPTMITALKANTIDGYVAEKPGAIADCNANSEFKYINLKNNDTGFAIEDLTNVTLAVGVKKNSELLAKLNDIIKNISVSEQEELMNNAITLAQALSE